MFCDTARTITTPSSSAALLTLAIVSCSLSVVGALIIIITFIVIPDIRNTTRKLVTCLAVADLLTPLGYLAYSVHIATSDDHYGNVCTLQSVVTTFASMVSFFLTIAISLHLFLTLYANTYNKNTLFVVANIVSWSLPGLIVAVAMSWGMLGADPGRHFGTGTWCWVKCVDRPTTMGYMFVTGKAWELLCYVSTFVLYLLVKRQMQMRYPFMTLGEISSRLRDDDQNFLKVWFILIAVRIWGTIRFFLIISETMDVGHFATVLLYLQNIGDPSQAFWNCILFCVLDKTVRRKFIACIRRDDSGRRASRDGLTNSVSFRSSRSGSIT